MKRWLPVIACMAMVILCGCAGSMDSVSDFLSAGPWWEAAQAGHISSRARELETGGELAMALDHWRLVQRISIDQAEAPREIARLEGKIAEAVQSHYQHGLAENRKKKTAAARDHFLAALHLDPNFQPALNQIKTCFSSFPLAVYLSMPDDRPTTVAKNVFGDEEKAFLVTWFNDLPRDETLNPGTLLILPKLEKIPIKKARIKKPANRLAAARTRLAANDLEGAMTLARQVNPAYPDVQALIHTIHLKKATAQIESGQFEDARQSLATVPDGFTDKDATLGKLTIALQQQQTAIDLTQARKQFDREHYQQSLDLAGAVLKDAPDSPDARDLAVEARYGVALDHFNHKRFLKAREVLAKADDGHKASTVLAETVRIQLAEQAQNHYRKGVKYFINENLKSAIAEWEIALACNPDHEKASENIDNARRLLDKIESMP